jgi:microcystin-dependent protein
MTRRNTTNLSSALILSSLTVMLALPAVALAQVPRFIPYSGRLTDGVTDPGNAEVDLLVKLFDCFCKHDAGCDASCPKDGEDPGHVHRERHDRVKTVNGYFSIHVGTRNLQGAAVPASLPRNLPGRMWIEISVKQEDAWKTLPRQEIGSVPYAVKAANGVPPGTVMAYAGPIDESNDPPPGWLLCDGQGLRKTEFPEIFGAIGVVHGNGTKLCSQGDCDFNVPDYRGRFLRGVARGEDRDPDRSGRIAPAPGGSVGDRVGSVQGHEFFGHRHNAGSLVARLGGRHRHDTYATAMNVGTGAPEDYRVTNNTSNNTFQGITSYHDGHTHEITGEVKEDGGAETRPTNAYVNWIIKY